MNYSYILLHIHFFRGHSHRLNVKLVHDPWVLPSIIFNQLSLFLSLRGSLCWPEDSMRWSSSAGRRWPCWRRATRDLRRPKSSCRGPSRSRRYSRCVCLGRGGQKKTFLMNVLVNTLTSMYYVDAEGSQREGARGAEQPDGVWTHGSLRHPVWWLSRSVSPGSSGDPEQRERGEGERFMHTHTHTHRILKNKHKCDPHAYLLLTQRSHFHKSIWNEFKK